MAATVLAPTLIGAATAAAPKVESVVAFPNGASLFDLLIARPSATVLPYDADVPTKCAWNLAIQRELKGGTAVVLADVGSPGRHQQRGHSARAV